MKKILFAGSAVLVMSAFAAVSANAHASRSSQNILSQLSIQKTVNYPNGQTCFVTPTGEILECWTTGTNPP